MFYNKTRPLSSEIGENGGISDNIVNISCLRSENGENGFLGNSRRNNLWNLSDSSGNFHTFTLSLLSFI